MAQEFVTRKGITSLGNLQMVGTSLRIIGDFSDATVTNRLLVQTNVTNSTTNFGIIPNGTNRGSNFSAYNNSDPTNSSSISLYTTQFISSLRADRQGTGTYLPLAFYTNGSEVMRITTGGNMGLNTSSPSAKFNIVGGSITTSISDAATTLNSRFDLANPAISLGIGYVSSDIPMLQSVNNGTNVATNLTINPFGGNVGIGTATPTQILSVNNPFSSAGALYPIVVSQQGSNEIGGLYSVADAITNPIGAGLAFKTYQQNVGLGEKVRITNGGNVGISASNPLTKLQISDNSIANAAGSNNISVYGSVGSGDAAALFLHQKWNSLTYPVGIGSTPDGVYGYASAGMSLYVSNFNGTGVTTTKAMYINPVGNVGIGTTSPSSKLGIFGGALNSDTSSYNLGLSSGLTAGRFTGYDAGTLSAISTYFDNSSTEISVGVSSGYVSGISFNAGTSVANPNTVRLFTASVERMRITSAGNVLINSTSTIASKLVVASSTSTSASYSAIFASPSGSDILDIRGDGLITMPFLVSVFTTGNAANVWTNPSNGDLYRSTSSIKYKKNVENYTKGLTELMQLRPVSYEGKSEVDAGKTFAGLIAEEVHELGLTEYVQYSDDGSPNALSYQNMVAILIKSVQELKNELETLKNK